MCKRECSYGQSHSMAGPLQAGRGSSCELAGVGPGNLPEVLCKNSMYSNHPSSPSFFSDLLLCVCMCTHACGTHRCHKKFSGPLELELGVVVVKVGGRQPYQAGS